MNKNIKSYTIIFILCFILGVLLSTQFKYDLSETSFVSLNSILDLKNEISKTRSEIESLKRIINEKKDKLVGLEDAISKGNISSLINEDIKKIKLSEGFTDVWGPGVYITVADSEYNDFSEYSQEYYDIVHDIYLTNIVNELKKNGAEAISIGGQRIMSNSEINCVGPAININKRSVTNPFIIKAVGDPKKLYNAISGSNGYGTYLKEYFNLKVKTQISDYVYISKYSRNLKFNYATKSKEGE